MRKSIYNANFWSFKPKKLAILVPVRDTVHSVFTASLVNLVKTSTLAGIDVHVIMDASTVLLNQRERLAEQALELGADYCLWLDSDMVFPSTTALRLLSHQQPIVAANYMKRSNPLTTVAYRKLGDWDSWVPLKESETLVEVEGIGMGCVMMQTRLFEQVEQPWFSFTYNEETRDWVGEDFFMFSKMREVGYKIMVDMNLSCQIRHIGTWAFGPDIGTNLQKIQEEKLPNVKKRLL